MGKFISADEKLCITECPEATPAYDTSDKICMTCTKLEPEDSKNAYWNGATEKCVEKCEGQSINLIETKCVTECASNEREDVDGKCVCDADSALATTGDKCLVPHDSNKECKRRIKENNVLKCITNQACND